MIEFYDTHSDKITYSEALMYCFALGPGWRLPTEKEYYSGEYYNIVKSFGVMGETWFFDDACRIFPGKKYYAIPVRDTEDDKIFKKVLDSLSQIQYNNSVN